MKNATSIVENSSDVLTIIRTTTNYELFGFISGNRNINNSNLKKIKDSLSKNYIDTNAIICILDDDEKQPLKIVDGQHRFEACKELGLKVSYIIDSKLKMSDILNNITLMNTASKEWDVNDFMVSESKKGNENYRRYQEIYNMTSNTFDHQAIFYILNSLKQRTYINFEMFKNGKLEFTQKDYEILKNRIQTLSKFNTFSEKGNKRHYQKALNDLMNVKKFDVNRMLFKLGELSQRVEKTNTITGALKQLADIYNHKLRSDKIAFMTVGGKINEIIIK